MYKYCILIIAFLSLGSFYPAYWTSALGYFPSLIHFLFLLIIWAVLIVYKKKSISRLSSTFNIFCACTIVYYILRIVLVGGISEQLTSIIRLSIFYFAVLLVKNSFSGYLFMKLFTKWNILMLLLTVVGLILFYSGFLEPIGEVSMSSSSEKKLLNYLFFFVKVSDSFDTSLSLLFVRPAGYYDEPGSFSYILLFLLIYNKLYVNDRKVEYIILVGGLFLLSMAFYISILLYIILFYVNRKKSTSFLLFALFVTLLIWFISNIDTEISDFFYRKTIDRIMNVLDGTDESRDFSAAFVAFKNNFILGTTTEELSRNYPYATAETIWYFMALNGIWGTLLLFSPFIYILLNSIRNRNILLLKAVFIILINFIQRPYFIEPLYLIILYFMFWCHKSDLKSNVRLNTGMGLIGMVH